jgi:putative membrane protein
LRCRAARGFEGAFIDGMIGERTGAPVIKPSDKIHKESSMKVSVSLLIATGLWAAPAFGQQRISSEDFAKKVVVSDKMEIQSSQLALSRNPDSDTKPFAEKMVKDHQETSAELKAMVDGGKVKATLPTALDAEHQKQLDELKAKSGKDFDSAYDHMQMQAHEEAVALFEQYARDGDNPDLKAWAAKTLPHLKEHLAMAKRLS